MPIRQKGGVWLDDTPYRTDNFTVMLANWGNLKEVVTAEVAYAEWKLLCSSMKIWCHHRHRQRKNWAPFY